MNNETNDITYDQQIERNRKELGLEVRRQGQGRARKELVFDPVTGEFVLGDEGVTGNGDIVTQMTEDGFAHEGAARSFRYNEETGDFEPEHGGTRRGGMSGFRLPPGVAEAIANGLAKLERGDLLLIGGGICSTLFSNWLGGAMIAIGMARKLGKL